MIRAFKKKSTNLFEQPEDARKVKILSIIGHEFDINKHGVDFMRFENLEELFLQNNGMYTSLLPEEIGRLKTLTKLYVLNYSYREFPEWVLNLKNLKSLMIRGNDIIKIPDQIGQLVQLEKLRIENCELVDLPDSVSNLVNLRKLSLSDNFKLTKLNISSLPKRLKVLNLSATGISNESLNEIRTKFPRLQLNKFVE